MLFQLSQLNFIFTVPVRMVGKPPSSIIIKRLNDVVRLNCTAIGAPIPTMYWEKNGHQVPLAEINSTTGLGLVKSEIILKQFVPNQLDVYSCVASNSPFSKTRLRTRVGNNFTISFFQAGFSPASQLKSFNLKKYYL